MKTAVKQRAGACGMIFCVGAALALALGGAAMTACEGDDLKQRPRSGSGQGAHEQEGGFNPGTDGPSGPPAADAGGLCGNRIHQVEIAEAPNIYFVLDASGSMLSPASSSASASRYDRVHEAAVDLVRNLGPLINVGAAVFPLDATDEEPCRPGGEVFPVTPGAPFAERQEGSTTTSRFRAATRIAPLGGTPTAATLEALAPKLVKLPGKTIVVLATDGGPNCNSSATCNADGCIANIEHQCPEENCCAPSGLSGPAGCLDRDDTVSAIERLAASGIDVYVVGIPGSEFYGDVLDQMAIAGGAAQFVSPFYFKVDNLDTLGNVLSKIASIVISCEFDLVDPPPEQGQTNVYLDDELVAYDPENGWRWKSPAVVELLGEACAKLKSGRVGQVQIVSGCPTEVAR
ncbi:vWA domain-containing protein [Sorangium sp. So ce1000]|uniref:vWA domain-containing protein n=1 Tax=Sorangium sp. So ce1000 TaxID=3133325 RepID=UPI003F64053F